MQPRRRRLDDLHEPVLTRGDADRRQPHDADSARPTSPATSTPRPRAGRGTRISTAADGDADRPGSGERGTRDPRHGRARVDDRRPDDERLRLRRRPGDAHVPVLAPTASRGRTIATPAAWDTTAVTDGIYQMQVLVTDFAGNTTTSATVANVKIDNTPPVTAQDDPGAYLRAHDHADRHRRRSARPAEPARLRRRPRRLPGLPDRRQHVDDRRHLDDRAVLGVARHDDADGRPLRLPHRRVPTSPATSRPRRRSRTASSTTRRRSSRSNDPGANLRGTIALSTNPAGTNDPGPNASGIVSTTYDGLRSTAARRGCRSARAGTRPASPTACTTSARSSPTRPATSAPRASSAPAASTTPPPVTTASGVPSGFSATDVTVTLNPTDAGSGVSDTLYSVDAGPTQHGTSVLIPAPVERLERRLAHDHVPVGRQRRQRRVAAFRQRPDRRDAAGLPVLLRLRLHRTAPRRCPRRRPPAPPGSSPSSSSTRRTA